MPTAAESPRAVADKRSKRALLRAIKMALRIESAAVRHNTQTFNRNRYAATAALPDYQELKDRARSIKEAAIANLPALLATLEASVRRNGGHFYLAKTAEEATRYIADVCRRAGGRLAVKGKSMTSEEVGLNRVLESGGMEVAETDLAEFILQVADEQPSHIIAPAIHYSRERITELFKRVFKTDLPLDTGEELTRFAREHLRQKFLEADIGISGANLIAADSGTIVLVESEGNIRMTSLLPPVHIAIAGMEKVVPSREDFGPFLELLAASATGQRLSSYTSILTPPLTAAPLLSSGGKPEQREFHLVLVDNGRGTMRQDPVLREALCCIRCSACLNSCANFQTVGGHAFGGETYSGGIGGSWEAGTRGTENARFSELCTGCSRCVPQCPVRIDIPWLNSVLRQRINEKDAGGVARMASSMLGDGSTDVAPLQKLFFGHYDLLGKWGTRMARLANTMASMGPARVVLEKVVGLDRRRALPPFASKTLVEMWRESAARRQPPAASEGSLHKAVVFADAFTNYGAPLRGMATVRVLEALGVDVVVSDVSADGRAALSQGLIKTAEKQARETAGLLRNYLEQGRDIVVVEPSVLAMFRMDYRHFLGAAEFDRLRDGSYDAAEYAWKIIQERSLDAAKLFPASQHRGGTKIFYHSHCQQKSAGAAAATEALLRAVGFDVATSQVECCGMAGSFGYKKEYYELSMAVGQDLFRQLEQVEKEGGRRTLVATGTSCQEQLHAGMEREAIYSMELLAEVAQPQSGGADTV
ncbi:MAG: LUD domain-containing protein [Terriglobales bacterium]